MAYETLLIEISDQTGIIRLNRPDDLNALNNTLMDEMTAALDDFEANEDIGCIVITGTCHQLSQAGYRGGVRLCAGRWLRACDDVRFHSRCRECKIRPA